MGQFTYQDYVTAARFAQDYTGTFQFLLDMQARVLADKDLTPNMVAAILRCKARDEKPATVATTAGEGVDIRALLPGPGTYYVALGQPAQFFKVDHVADGKWAGWVFVKRQAGDNFDRAGSARPGDLYRGGYSNLFRITPSMFLEAMGRYGQEIGKCGNCNRTLTDEASRARGIGPDCWAMLGGAMSDAGFKSQFAAREAAQERAAFLAAEGLCGHEECDMEPCTYLPGRPRYGRVPEASQW